MFDLAGMGGQLGAEDFASGQAFQSNTASLN
jgi:hypothetical protein